ncbi:polyprenyl diphosphate synthase [Conexibacter woesei]|uniref:Isoprenyl transferase n=1 Tax=Conexibacter woesei (strain DSM 14684 / CCUG 47730 / CIP 108061 / JCM 11494 / NBRC 100937 / ID131577) TaxID=469383 RepID=D3F3B2_CONWI|nr:polyprenyl diphosphate synthase [Conexibacter woesei]ADB50392.1 undecaprenyl diphosphate synthase [Conexibacter woesei DSM 14684]
MNEPHAPAPATVAIITDGNGRWAQQRGLPVWEGHRAGAENVRSRLRDAAELGIEQLSIYAFSTENWTRDDDEIAALMGLMRLYIEHETPTLHAEGVRMRFIGRRTAPVPRDVVELMSWAERLTQHNRRITFFIPFNYGGRAEIVDAARSFTGTTEAEFAAQLYAPELRPPEVVIRTGGERRISNYLIWHIATSQLVFRDELWPDFTREALLDALAACPRPA